MRASREHRRVARCSPTPDHQFAELYYLAGSPQSAQILGLEMAPFSPQVHAKCCKGTRANWYSSTFRIALSRNGPHLLKHMTITHSADSVFPSMDTVCRHVPLKRADSCVPSSRISKAVVLPVFGGALTGCRLVVVLLRQGQRVGCPSRIMLLDDGNPTFFPLANLDLLVGFP